MALILSGSSVACSGALPGDIALLCDEAKAVVCTERQDDISCEVAASTLGLGRVVAVAHESFVKNPQKHAGAIPILQ